MLVCCKILVATVLTVYGIETQTKNFLRSVVVVLQQYLPFTVLKQDRAKFFFDSIADWLQQYLPFTVLKLAKTALDLFSPFVATVLTVYGIETIASPNKINFIAMPRCNSTYRLRY